MEPIIIRVRYSDCDRMGRVYHVNYLEYFEWARAEWLRHLWKPYKELEDDGYYLVVIEAHIKYRLPASYDDLLSVSARPVEWGRSRIKFDYTLHRPADGKLLCTGDTLHCFTNRSGKAIGIPLELRQLLEKTGSEDQPSSREPKKATNQGLNNYKSRV